MKTIIVTGASKGIGAAITRQLLDLGHKVIGVSRSSLSISNPQLVHIKGDVGDQSTLLALQNSLDGPIHGLILNAGYTGPITTLSNVNIEEFRRVLETSLISPIVWMKELLPQLRQGTANIIYTSSAALKTPMACWGFFTSPRAAMHQFFTSLAKEEPKITCFSVEPGIVDTEAFHKAYDQVKANSPAAQVKWFESIQNSKALLKPDQPAEAFVKLVLGVPKSVSGQIISWNEDWIRTLPTD